MVSFIIPTYNASSTIKRAVDSILNQTIKKKEYEIIVVDDGSNDNLDKLIDENYKDCHQVKYYRKENGGLSDARNYGVEKANGKYLIFVDADDYVSTNLLDDIKEYIEKDIDLIKWNPIWVDNNGNEIKRDTAIKLDTVVTGQVGFNKLYGTDPMLACAWNYCIKKSIFYKFPKGRYHEDFAVIPLIILQAETMAITDKYEYYYVQTDNSIMRSNDSNKTRKKLEDILINYDNLINVGNGLEVDKITKENLGIFGAYSLLAKVDELNKEDKKYFISELNKRKIISNIKVRNVKQIIKKLYLVIKYQLY